MKITFRGIENQKSIVKSKDLHPNEYYGQYQIPWLLSEMTALTKWQVK